MKSHSFLTLMLFFYKLELIESWNIMKNILKIILCVLVCYIAIGIGWVTKDIIIHENVKDGIAILGYHGVVSDQEKKANYASNPYFMSISEFEKQMKYLAENNYQCLSMEDVKAYYKKI